MMKVSFGVVVESVHLCSHYLHCIKEYSDCLNSGCCLFHHQSVDMKAVSHLLLMMVETVVVVVSEAVFLGKVIVNHLIHKVFVDVDVVDHFLQGGIIQ